MSLEQIHEDLRFLAGGLQHRRCQTGSEHEAACYIEGRLKEYAPGASLDSFEAIENYPFLFASYFTEFMVTAIIALWWPAFALGYGAFAFTAYLAEFMGLRVFARFLPHFDTQNVEARFLAPRPKHLFIVTAYYDSGTASPLTHPRLVPWLRPLHLLLILCMILVLATCATDALGAFTGEAYAITGPLRAGAAALLGNAAIFLFFCATQGEDTRGANNNASGVAALLQLAQDLAANPLEEADVWLVATGSHDAWMSGMRHLLAHDAIDKPNTYILNIEAVGAGALHFSTAEGLLHPMPTSKKMLQAATLAAPEFGVLPKRMTGLPTEAQTALARGFKALSIAGLDTNGYPPHWNQSDDLLTAVDETKILQAARFAAALLRHLQN